MSPYTTYLPERGLEPLTFANDAPTTNTIAPPLCKIKSNRGITLTLFKNRSNLLLYLIVERVKQKSERELEFHRKRSMNRDTAAKRIMRESLSGTNGDKPVILTRRTKYSLLSTSGCTHWESFE